MRNEKKKIFFRVLLINSLETFTFHVQTQTFAASPPLSLQQTLRAHSHTRERDFSFNLIKKIAFRVIMCLPLSNPGIPPLAAMNTNKFCWELENNAISAIPRRSGEMGGNSICEHLENSREIIYEAFDTTYTILLLPETPPNDERFSNSFSFLSPRSLK